MKTELPSPPELASMQAWLRWIFTDPRGVDSALERRALDENGSSAGLSLRAEPAPRLSTWIQEDADLPVSERLGVYSNAYFRRLVEALSSNFPATARALGADSFERLVAGYLTKFPPASPSIEDAGRHLANFLGDHVFSTTMPFLQDLANLEWSVLVSIYTGRLPALHPSDLQQIPAEAWNNVRIVLDPTVQLLRVNYAVEKLWRHRLLAPEKGKHRVSGVQPHTLIIYRDEEWAQVRSLAETEAEALRGLSAGLTLGDVCGQLEERHQDRGESVAIQNWFADWVRSGIIKKVISL